MKYADWVGRIYGRYTVLEAVFQDGRNQLRCKCTCGAEHVVRPDRLARNKSGCLECNPSAKVKHNRSFSPGYNTWHAMHKRCRGTTTSDYTKRGITVCERWASFEKFFADMGPKPSAKHSLDRINNDGNYEPDNCRWATPVEQARNRRSTRNITHEGKTQCVMAWAQEIGVRFDTLSQRIERGLPLAKCLTPGHLKSKLTA